MAEKNTKFLVFIRPSLSGLNTVHDGSTCRQRLCSYDSMAVWKIYYALSNVHRVGHNALMAVVCLSVCLSVFPVPDPKSRMEGHTKLKKIAVGGVAWWLERWSRPANFLYHAPDC